MRPVLTVLATTLVLSCASPPPRVDAPLLPEVDRTTRSDAPLARGAPPTEAAPIAKADVPVDVAIRNALLDRHAATDTPDAALFRKAHEAFAQKDPTSARKAFFELIQRHPQSPLVPYAYLAFGDMFFDEAHGDPSKYALAKQAYYEVIKYPPPANESYAYALHRAGLTSAAMKELQQALDFQRKALAALAQYKELPARDALLVSARHELVAAYAMAGAPDKALLFFKATDPENAPALVLALGEAYVQAGSVREAVATYDLALKSNKTDATCAAAAAAYKTLGARTSPQDARLLATAEQQRQTMCR